MNGELDSVVNGGFNSIFIHFQTDHHVEIDSRGVTVQGQTVAHHTGQDTITAGR